MLVDESSNDQVVEVRIGQSIAVHLEENRTTGFRWHLTSEAGPACMMIDDAFSAPPVGRPGEGGYHDWRFEAVRPGEGTIELRYRRSWERPGADARVFKIHVKTRS